MIPNAKYYNQRLNSVSLLQDRQYGYGVIDRYTQRRLHAAPSFIDRLEQEAVLKGHEGCVNCLEWSSDGRILASGSDDLQVILWDPFRRRRLSSIRTKHAGNMFSVKFLPGHNDALLATGAADKHIYVFDVNRCNDTLVCCICHTARVKRLATAPDSPYVFWSAGEDGSIMQLDLRETHRCRTDDSRVRLLDLTTCLHSNAEAKCLAINPRRTEQLAVGANDPYARIYDRRMLRLSRANVLISLEMSSSGNPVNVGQNLPKDCVSYYCPGHINKNNSKLIEHESRAITYLTFNAAGTELLVNMGGDHIYLYDLLNAEQPVYLSLPDYKPNVISYVIGEQTDANSSSSSSSSDGSIIYAVRDTTSNCNTPITTGTTTKRHKLPEHIEFYKKMGNEFLENEKYLRAIDQYSEAIALSPDCPVLYLNRATAYMRRLWYGDVYAALRDCHQALRLDPSYIKAHFRLARALLELGRPIDADECLKELINRFPSYAHNHGVMMLRKDIKENRQSAQTQHLQQQQQEHQRQQQQGQQDQDDDGGAGGADNAYNLLEIMQDEYMWRSQSKDYSKRFVGHCNTTTDIKEANYFGYNGEFIVAGSDDGNFFIWQRSNCKIRAAYKADSAIVNCVQPHPDVCLMATSGIDHDVKLWSPMVELPDERHNLISYIDGSVEANQQKMKTDPFDLNTPNALCRSS